jgi:hypothetical protein
LVAELVNLLLLSQNQSASETPAGGATMTCSLCLRCKRESSCRQVLGGGGDVQLKLFRRLNG